MTSYQRLKNKISKLEKELSEVYRQRNMLIENKDEDIREISEMRADYLLGQKIADELFLGTFSLSDSISGFKKMCRENGFNDEYYTKIKKPAFMLKGGE